MSSNKHHKADDIGKEKHYDRRVQDSAMIELLLRNRPDHLFTLLQVFGDVPVLVGHVSDHITLSSEVRVGSAHDTSSLVTLLFNVNQLVVHVVKLASAVKKLLAHVTIKLFLGLLNTTK